MDEAVSHGARVQKMWVSTLDPKTRDAHRRLDHQVVLPEEYFEIDGKKALQPHMFGIASEDCNCRCTSISVIKGYEPSVRRDNMTGDVIDDVDYVHWKERKIRENGKTWWDVEEKKARNEGRDRVQWHSYRDLLGKRVPKNLADFQDVKYTEPKRWKQLKNNIKEYRKWESAKFPTQKSYEGHYVAHKAEFGEITKEQYLKIAQDVMKYPIGGNLLGYDLDNGRRVRYDIKNNIIVIGNKNGFTTCFRPKEGIKYYEQNKKRDLGQG